MLTLALAALTLSLSLLTLNPLTTVKISKIGQIGQIGNKVDRPANSRECWAGALMDTVNPANRQVGIASTLGFLLTQLSYGCP